MTGSVPLWVKLAGVAAAVYCIAVFGALYRYNQSILANASFAEITGGGFIYNYRIADIRAGITVGLVKPLPLGTRLVAEFERPQGGKIEIEKAVSHARRNYSFETPSLSDVEADRTYTAVLHVLDAKTGQEIEQHEKGLKSGVAPKAMPTKALTIGPGYHINPEIQPAPKG
ncbi:hypothetical protein SIAM614_17714 [Roseibium aggregatum IAM 12614]|uniref:Uncharacterized protein n=1 Tax=Roseibium aggregatum (strain ATCC 25650 / DSM 13394 / JCM 20685 / NBRC 16684 / NCIMB 2208 / IAM 12614 / B1) TaxID=384765 RepID=A0NP23_ROSAI|nr:hypothetical protein [Roseibium aggregatum]EAV45186.1 hypothetical protein SIAM614_17714 [Roseibium aggregatum IAM 12614]